jgi:fructose-1,6-bisphosphatase/inositol monophosphatase family enzyme
MNISDADLARSLVQEAGALARRMRAEGLDAERKSHVADIVTAADRAAEDLIVERLAKERPDDAIVGEEGTDRAGTSGRTWVIDPVDGTYNFHRGLGWWCSALALVDGEDLVLGAVHHPHDDATYVGGPGLPSTRNGVPLLPLQDVPIDEACATTYLHPPFYDGEVGAAFNRAVAGVATLRMLGSGTMDAMAIAQGKFDVLFQHSVPDWDRLPGEAVILGAGGATRVVEAAGVSWFVAGAPACVDAVCAALTSPS